MTINWIKCSDKVPESGSYRIARNEQLCFVALKVPDAWQFIGPENHLHYAIVRGLPLPFDEIHVDEWLPIHEGEL